MTTITCHFADSCVMPSCLCVDAPVVMMLKNGRLTSESSPKPYVEGVVTEVTEIESGGYNVKVRLDESIMPLDEDSNLIPPSFGNGGNGGSLCNPLCAEECDWISAVLALVAWAGKPTLQTRSYELYGPTEQVDDGTFKLPRIPFVGGFKLSKISLSCYTYDIGTTLTVTLKVGTTVIATYTGDLSSIKFMTIAVENLTLDQLPKVEVTSVLGDVYDNIAKGLVIELMGVA